MIQFLQFSVQGIAAGSLYSIVAIGLVFLYRGSRVLNFAHAEFGALGAYVFWHLYPEHWWLPLALLAGVAAGASAGLVTERFVARPLRGTNTLLLAVATLAVAEILRFVIFWVFGPESRTVPPLMETPTLVIGRIVLPAQRVLILVVSLALSGLLVLFLRKTLFGIAVRGASEDLESVRLRGIRSGRVTAFIWVVSAGLSAIAAILASPILGLSPFFMTLVLIRAFAAALVGGMTSLGGAVVGGLVIGFIESHLQSITSYPGAVEAALFGLVLVILLVRPHGLFGSEEAQQSAGLTPLRKGITLPFKLSRLPPRDARLVAIAVLVAGTAALGMLGEYEAFLGAVAASYAIAGVSIFVLSGLSGQLSIGHAALMGAGGFAAGILTSQVGLPFLLTIPVAGIVAAGVALVVGLPAFRIRGLYLAVSTLAFGIAAERFVFRLTVISGGSQGTSLPNLSARSILITASALLVVAVILAGRIRDSKSGRALAVLHSNETLAESWGIRTSRYKLFAFAVSGFLAGCAGVTYAALIGHITSEAFTLNLSITIVAMAIVGGLGSVGGVMAGAVLFALLPEVLRGAELYLPLAYGATLLGVILFLPGGIAQLWQRAE